MGSEVNKDVDYFVPKDQDHQKAKKSKILIHFPLKTDIFNFILIHEFFLSFLDFEFIKILKDTENWKWDQEYFHILKIKPH